MAQEIKDLIEKIQKEGVEAAEEKARHIEAEARSKADALLKEARAEAERLMAQAQDKCAGLKKSAQIDLQQAARDLLLFLRQEISAMLERIVVERVREALSPEELARIIRGLIKECAERGEGELCVALSPEDAKKLQDIFLAELKDKIRQGIVLKSSAEISGGFIISYDAGRSHYDFTDRAIASYIGTYLKPRLAELFKEIQHKT